MSFFSKKTGSVNLRKPLPQQRTSWFPRFVLVLVIVVIMAGGVYGYRMYGAHNETKNYDTAQQLIDEIGKHIILPADEKPTIATVLDPKVLEGQPFFAKALKGDRVLVYPNAKRAYLYRPSEQKLVEVMPFVPHTEAEAAQ